MGINHYNCKINYLYFKICVGFEGGSAGGGGSPNKHSIYSLNLVGHVHLGK